jgi:probable non-F420 flavinoid oxidoreductase
MQVGYHASHEQFEPGRLLSYVQLAEEVGFAGAMCSDHFNPWSERQGNSAFAWSWLGAALQATQFSFGTVCAPGQRYHPGIIAQAVGTLASMYPGRFWVALGSGELLNEHITGERWPTKDERNQRLLECVSVMRRLLAGEEVTHFGLVRIERARLYVRPANPPPLFAAALTSKTAHWAGGWADGLITAAGSVDDTHEVISAFRAGGGEGKPVHVQLAVSYGETDEEAVNAALDQWRMVLLGSQLVADLALPGDFDTATALAEADDLKRAMRVSSDLADHVNWLREMQAIGVDRTFVHCVHRDQEAFLRAYSRVVLPYFVG